VDPFNPDEPNGLAVLGTIVRVENESASSLTTCCFGVAAACCDAPSAAGTPAATAAAIMVRAAARGPRFKSGSLAVRRGLSGAPLGNATRTAPGGVAGGPPGYGRRYATTEGFWLFFGAKIGALFVLSSIPVPTTTRSSAIAGVALPCAGPGCLQTTAPVARLYA
jgi:hypothetical protein